eukprot:scaffold247739_cov14-Tisochrysis_lutea.AAC.1
MRSCGCVRSSSALSAILAWVLGLPRASVLGSDTGELVAKGGWVRAGVPALLEGWTQVVEVAGRLARWGASSCKGEGSSGSYGLL